MPDGVCWMRWCNDKDEVRFEKERQSASSNGPLDSEIKIITENRNQVIDCRIDYSRRAASRRIF